jgi:hypothetical protein
MPSAKIKLPLASLLLALSLSVGGALKAETDPGWIRLFDGRTLDGWFVKCRPEDEPLRDAWRVEQGAITARIGKGQRHNYIWLLTEREFDNFELRLKVQTFARVKGNSGVQVRSRYDDATHWLDGPQVDIHPAGPWRCGFIYDETREVKAWLWPDVGAPANAKAHHAPPGWHWHQADTADVWNDVRIICRGPHIKTIINGVTVADYDGTGRLDDAAHRAHRVGMKGHLALQIHPGTEMLVRFKDLRLRPLD